MNTLYKSLLGSFLVPVLAACGSGGDTNQNKTQATSSSQTVSSQQSLTVDYVYPGHYSHAGEQSKTAVILRTPQKLDRVYLGSVEFMEVGDNVWRAPSVDLQSNTLGQTLGILGVSGSDTFTFQPLVVSNDLSQNAGVGSQLNSADSAVFSPNGSTLYFSESQFGRVSELNLATAEMKTLYQSADKKVNYWPLALDSDTQNLYFIEHDNFYSSDTFDDSLGANLTNINLVTQQVISTPMAGEKINVSALIIDSDKVYPFSKGRTLGYLVDKASDVGLKALILDGDDAAAMGSMNTAYGTNAEFTPDEKRADIALSADGQIIYTLKNTPSPALLQLTSFVDELGSSSLLEVKMPLKYMDLAVKNAKSLALSPFNSSIVYVAGERTIWRANIETGLLEAISSSIPGNTARGDGPSFSGELVDIQHHPKADVLFVSQGSFGMMAVDIESGDRSIVIN